jgi:hypothetical protein
LMVILSQLGLLGLVLGLAWLEPREAKPRPSGRKVSAPDRVSRE